MAYGPIVVRDLYPLWPTSCTDTVDKIPELWRNCLPADPSRLLHDRKERIRKEEDDKVSKKKAAADAKKLDRAEKEARKEAAKAQKHAEKEAEKARKQRAKEAEKARKLAEKAMHHATRHVQQAQASTSRNPQETDCAHHVSSPHVPPNTPAHSEHAQSTPRPEGPPLASTASSDDSPYSMHPDDPANFLKLSEALRLLGAQILTAADITRADTLLREYNTELITVCLLLPLLFDNFICHICRVTHSFMDLLH